MNHKRQNFWLIGRATRRSLIYGKLETALVLDGLTEELNLADWP